jgi:hypothetical protein
MPQRIAYRGTVTGLRISSANGVSFVDNLPSAVTDLVAADPGNLLVEIYDASGRMLRGYLGAAGTGETWPATLVSMLHFNGENESTTFTDEKGKTWTPVDGAKISTTKSLFGGSAAYFDGDGDYIGSTDHDDWDMGTGEWTVSFWFNAPVQSVNYPTVISTQAGWFANSIAIRWDNVGYDRKIGFYRNPDNPLIASTSQYAADAWNHVAVIREGNNVKIYVNGVLNGTQAIDAGSTFDWTLAAGNVRIGFSTWDKANGYYQGYISEMAVYKGTALWTANFTPPGTHSLTPSTAGCVIVSAKGGTTENFAYKDASFTYNAASYYCLIKRAR